MTDTTQKAQGSGAGEALRDRLGGWANMMFARYGHPVLLVGSTLSDKSLPVDVDLTITLPDEEFAGRFGDWRTLRSTDRSQWSDANMRWASTMAKEARWLAARTGINADFKIRCDSWVGERHAGKPSVRLDDAALSQPPEASEGEAYNLSKLEEYARKICVDYGIDADEVVDDYGPVRRLDSAAYHLMKYADEVAAHPPKPADQLGEARREVAALREAERELAPWMSAALDDPASGEAFKAAANAWLEALTKA